MILTSRYFDWNGQNEWIYKQISENVMYHVSHRSDFYKFLFFMSQTLNRQSVKTQTSRRLLTNYSLTRFLNPFWSFSSTVTRPEAPYLKVVHLHTPYVTVRSYLFLYLYIFNSHIDFVRSNRPQIREYKCHSYPLLLGTWRTKESRFNLSQNW